MCALSDSIRAFSHGDDVAAREALGATSDRQVETY